MPASPQGGTQGWGHRKVPPGGVTSSSSLTVPTWQMENPGEVSSKIPLGTAKSQDKKYRH